MTLTNAIRTTILTSAIVAAAGGTSPVQAQSAGTVIERVVVTLPNGKRVVKTVERFAPQPTPAPAPSTGGDPFAGGETPEPPPGQVELGEVPEGLDPRILAWIEMYREGDLRADANRDGKLSPADFSQFIATLRDSTPPSDPPPPPPPVDDGDPTPDGDGDTPGGDSDGGTIPDLATGWTDLERSADSRVIYVSSSQGNDANDGLSPDRPVKTVDAGERLLRDGKPDWLLLRRGDTFRESFGEWNKSGRSSSERMVVWAYGEGPRPRLITGTSTGISMNGDARRAHLAFMGIHFEPGVRKEAHGIRWITGGVHDVLVEDCLFSSYRNNIVVQGTSTDDMTDIVFRRNVVLDAAGSTHSQGIYATKIDGLQLIENIFDRNGWDHQIGRSNATIYAHNIYLQRTVKDLVMVGNITSRASSHGAQARNGGVVNDNVSFLNPIGILFGNEGARADEPPVNGTVIGNLVVEGINLNEDKPRSWGIQLQNTASVRMTGNIVANSAAEGDIGWGLSISGHDSSRVRGAVITGNIIDDFGRAIKVDELNAVDVTFTDNRVTKSYGDEVLVDHSRGTDADGVRYAGNIYRHEAASRPFTIGNEALSLADWRADFDSRARETQSEYVNGEATMETYARSIGLGGEEQLIQALRSQRRGAYDERLTAAAIQAYFRSAFTVHGGI
jgi:hypothetical protein